MNDQNVKTTLDEAGVLFQTAQEGLYKPQEDVVQYMVCKNAYKSIDKYLTGFLMQHGRQADPSTTMKELLELCRSIDSKFNNLNLDLLYNSHEESDVWMDIETAKEFMELATQTQKMIN